MHAANLIRAIKRHRPDARFVGVAGPRMAEAGCEVLLDLTKKATMLGGPFLRVGYYIRQIHRIKKAIRAMKPDVHVPVDSPALNWHLAKASKSVSVPVVYYIAPQVWAWAPWRVNKLRRLTDHVACILPFEEDYLRQRGVQATYVGHPLFDELGAPVDAGTLPDISDAWINNTWRVALLPGSRDDEIRGHIRALTAAAEEIKRRWGGSRCVVTARDERAAELIRKHCEADGVEIAVGRTREVLADSHFAVAVSGTVTLEAAHFGVPMVVFYRTGGLLRMLKRTIGRWVVSTPHLALANILAGRRIVPELMPWSGRINRVTRAATEFMADVGALLEAREELLKVSRELYVPPPATASDNAAKIVCEHLRNG